MTDSGRTRLTAGIAAQGLLQNARGGPTYTQPVLRSVTRVVSRWGRTSTKRTASGPFSSRFWLHIAREALPAKLEDAGVVGGAHRAGVAGVSGKGGSAVRDCPTTGGKYT